MGNSCTRELVMLSKMVTYSNHVHPLLPILIILQLHFLKGIKSAEFQLENDRVTN
jgi:hypothetical protein